MTQLGFYLQAWGDPNPNRFFVWPWNRRKWRQNTEEVWNESRQECNYHKKRMRSLGASEAAIFHAYEWVGTPRNSCSRRFWAWLRGDYQMLWTLRLAAKQKSQKGIQPCGPD